MNVWRLISFHMPEHSVHFADWMRKNGTLAIGWGGMGDLNKQEFLNEEQLKWILKSTHPNNSPGSCANGGRSLWRFHHEMEIGDLVIISASGSREHTMRVTGDYYYVNNGDDPSHGYEHRRKAEVVRNDPNHLWQTVNKVAQGEGVYSTLVRCDRKLTEAEVVKLTD